MESTKLRSTLSSSFLTIYGLGCVLVNVLTLYLRDGVILSIFALSLSAIITIPSFFYLVESPKWLYENGKFNELFSCLEFISTVNKTNFDKKKLLGSVLDDGESLINKFEGFDIKVNVIRKETGKGKSILKELFTTKR